MANRFAAFIYRTRGTYMFLALTISMIIKYLRQGTSSLALFIFSIVIMIVVQSLRMYTASYLWGRQAVSQPEADFLCTAGPYAYVRNPLYLGNFLIGIGLCLAINEWYAYVLFIISYAFVYSIIIPHEEKFLYEEFGDDYIEYKTHTRRFIPRLKAYKGKAETMPDYKAGILGEIHVPIFLIIISAVIYFFFV